MRVLKKMVRILYLFVFLLAAICLPKVLKKNVQEAEIEVAQEEPVQMEPIAEEEPEEAFKLPEVVRVREQVELPGVYDYRLVDRAPTVKNQGEKSNCWAYAGTSALESGLLPEARVAFSADHMTSRNSYAISEEEGGAYTMAVAYLVSWQGPFEEPVDAEETGEENSRQVLGVRFPDYKDYDTIKQTVLLHGGVESSIYMDFMELDGSSPSYNPQTYSYCYTGETEPNHDVLIIGWDDTYPADRFLNPPEGDGAFICQNSWGTSFGEEGIFYVSYFDSTIGGSNSAYTRVEDAGYFDGIYQSDLCGWTGQLGYNEEDGWFANVFTARGAETLAGVGFYTTDMESIYEIYVVPEYTDAFSLNDRVFVCNGYLQYAGYHTIEFGEETTGLVPDAQFLEEGQRFAVVVHLTTENAGYPIAVEHEKEENLLSVVDLTDGESFISSRGMIWSDAEDECGSNVCLKAYVNGR